MKDLNIYSIGEAANISGLSASTLRYYDAIHLISPEKRGDSNNYRYYTHTQVVTLCIIHRMKDLDCSLADIRTFIETDDSKVLCAIIQKNIRELNHKIDHLQKILTANQHYLKRLDLLQSDDFQNMGSPRITVETIPQVCLFTYTQLLENYDISKTSVSFWQSFLNQCKKFGYNTTTSHYTTYQTPLLGQFTMTDCTVRFGLEVPPETTGDDLIHFGNFTAATMIHVGSYHNIIDSYLQLLRWISQHGYAVDGDVTEQMILSPMDTVIHQVVKIIIPIKPSHS